MKLLKLSAQIFFVLLSLSAFLSCTKQQAAPNTPEGVLDQYVHTAFSAKTVEDGHKLLELSTGEARDWLAGMSEEAFKKQFVDNYMVFQSLKMQDKRQDKNGDVSLIYELAFKDGKTPNAAAYTSKKIAFLTKDEKGEWKIRATKNVKSFVERKDDLVITPETTDKNPAPESK